MSQKTSHIAQVRGQYAYNRKQVLYLTGMSDAMVSQFQFDTGLQWLTQYCIHEDDMLRWLLSQPLIWKWWLNEWNRRDDEFLSLLYSYYENCPDEIMMRYHRLHKEVFVNNTIPWVLLEDGYNRAIGELNRELCKK